MSRRAWVGLSARSLKGPCRVMSVDLAPKSRVGFNCDHVVAQRGEPGSIAAASSPRIENAAPRLRQ